MSVGLKGDGGEKSLQREFVAHSWLQFKAPHTLPLVSKLKNTETFLPSKVNMISSARQSFNRKRMVDFTSGEGMQMTVLGIQIAQRSSGAFASEKLSSPGKKSYVDRSERVH